MFSKAPAPALLLQQAAFGMAAVAHPNAVPGVQRELVADLLEEVFRCISDQKTVVRFKDAFEDWNIDVKRLQFCLMRALCVLYAEVRSAAVPMVSKCFVAHATSNLTADCACYGCC